MKQLIFLIVPLISMLVMGCGGAAVTEELSGEAPVAEDTSFINYIGFDTLYVAHYWGDGPEAEQLDAALRNFGVINDITIISEPIDVTGRNFEQQVAAGLGPDVIIGLPYEQIIPMATESKILRSISRFQISPADFPEQHLDLFRYNDELYALPFMMQTSVLYYNRAEVKTPPNLTTSLDGLLTELDESGLSLAMNSNFVPSYWGIRAFTNTLYAPSGAWETGPDDYTAWFTWLIENQEKPNVIFNDQTWFLEQKFVDGDVAYLIGSTASLVRLREQVGEDVLGVAPIPRGPAGFAEPLGQPEVIVFNRYTTPQAVRMGLRLAKFLYNPALQQQFVLQGVGHAPGYRPPEGSRPLIIRPNLSETGSTLAQQGRRSIIIPVNDIAAFRDLRTEANTIYLDVLNGGLEPAEASERLSERITNLLPAPEETEN